MTLCLVKFWLKQQWINNDLGVFDIETPMGANEPADRLPFTDDEIERIYSACDKIGEIAWKNGLGRDSWSGQDVKDFIILSVFTGLRISDVAMFDVEKRLQGNNIFLRAKKNNRRLFTWVPNWVRDRLLDRQQKVGSRIFQVGESERLETVTDTWRKKLKLVFEIAQEERKFEQKPTPHRFRYTFVRILLQNGVPVSDVAELAGDTPEIIIKHYAKWVPEIQERLTSILKAEEGIILGNLRFDEAEPWLHLNRRQNERLFKRERFPGVLAAPEDPMETAPLLEVFWADVASRGNSVPGCALQFVVAAHFVKRIWAGAVLIRLFQIE
jgi:hypothetical protein